MSAPANVVFVMPDKLGGMFTIASKLAAHRSGDLPYGAVLTHSRRSREPRTPERLPVDWQVTVEDDLPSENVRVALRRLRRAFDGPGALVTNDLIELAAVAAYPVDRAVFSIAHGDHDYYYDLAARHEPEIDVFIAYSEAMYRGLLARLPHRADTIVHQPYGVRLGAHRVQRDGPLRVLYVGRLAHPQKGVLHLPAIDALLREAAVDVTWTIVGTGPDEALLRAAWTGGHIRWLGARTEGEALATYPEHDVLVMPSRFEGFPAVLLEAAAAGVVPVASDLASGVREVIDDGSTGWRIAVDDVHGFAAAIAGLARDRARLERMSAALRERAARRWDIRVRAAEYEALFARWRELRRPPRPPRMVYGSRLDKAWIPNAVVKAIRRRLHPVSHADA